MPIAVACFSVKEAISTSKKEAAFDPVDLQLESKGRPTEHVVKISHKEHVVLVTNGKPGMSWMKLKVNGHRLPVMQLSSGESTSLDIGAYLFRGHLNEVIVTADGKENATSWVVFTEP